MQTIFGKKSKKEKSNKESVSSVVDSKKKVYKALVIDSDSDNWHPFFRNSRTSDGGFIEIEKSEWSGLIVSCDSNSRPIVSIRANRHPTPGTNENQHRTMLPDAVLVRQLVRGLTPDENYSNALYGLHFGGVLAVNSLESICTFQERPFVYSHLAKIQKRLGKEMFPLVPMSYYSHQSAMMFTPDLPIVIKVGSAEAGYGKIKINEQQQLADFRSCLALHKDYATAERYIDKRVYDIRVQKIGDHVRVYKRVSASWKGNVGSSILEEIEVSDSHRLWANEVGKEFGMDILTVDAIHTEDGKDHILEINDCASGLAPVNEKEDMQIIADLLVKRLDEQISKKDSE